MPITNTLANAQELEEAGIPKNQVIERSQHESQVDLKCEKAILKRNIMCSPL